MNRSSWLARYERLGIIPVSMLGLGCCLAYVAEPLGANWGGLAFVGGLAMIFVGVPLLFVYLIGYYAIKVLQRVGTTTGMVVGAPDPPPPLVPGARCPAWRVTLPDGPHTVYIGDDIPSPKRLACDGQWVELTWPRKWGKPEAAFTISGHRATLVIAPDAGRTFSAKNWFGLGGVSSLVYRRDLHVDGASIEPLDAGATTSRR